MNLIKRIKVDNIKGKSSFEIPFVDLTANQPNIIVAPNGYGKSTITTAFKSAMHGKMKLDIRDIYQQNADNHPCLEIELLGKKPEFTLLPIQIIVFQKTYFFGS